MRESERSVERGLYVLASGEMRLKSLQYERLQEYRRHKETVSSGSGRFASAAVIRYESGPVGCSEYYCESQRTTAPLAQPKALKIERPR